jgi:hypothetical protein
MIEIPVLRSAKGDAEDWRKAAFGRANPSSWVEGAAVEVNERRFNFPRVRAFS